MHCTGACTCMSSHHVWGGGVRSVAVHEGPRNKTRQSTPMQHTHWNVMSVCCLLGIAGAEYSKCLFVSTTWPIHCQHSSSHPHRRERRRERLTELVVATLQLYSTCSRLLYMFERGGSGRDERATPGGR
eukprot:2129261-Prymnesium_polylepis.1